MLVVFILPVLILIGAALIVGIPLLTVAVIAVIPLGVVHVIRHHHANRILHSH